MPFEREYKDLAFVPRWGIIRQIKGQSVAEHSYYVALYADQICDILELDSATKILTIRYALYHDVEECFTSDIPGPVKRSTKMNSKHFVDQEMSKRFGDVPYNVNDTLPKAIVKVADCLDETLQMLLETSLGNKNLDSLIEQCKARLSWNLAHLNEQLPEDKSWRFNTLNKSIITAMRTERGGESSLLGDK